MRTNEEAPDIYPGLRLKRHTEQWTARTSWGVASRMSLRHLPTNAGHGRPAEHQRCCGRKPRHCLRCVRSHPHGWGPRVVPGITHAGLDDSRLLRIAVTNFPSAKCGRKPPTLLFFLAEGHRPER